MRVRNLDSTIYFSIASNTVYCATTHTHDFVIAHWPLKTVWNSILLILKKLKVTSITVIVVVF